MVRVLYIDGNPMPVVIESAFKEANIPIELITVKSFEQAELYLNKESDKFDAIFIGYKLVNGEITTVELVGVCNKKGFGAGKKPLIAFSQGNNNLLVEAGCSHACRYSGVSDLVARFFKN